MSALAGIPVRVERGTRGCEPPEPGGLGSAGVTAILHELGTLLVHLAERHEPAAIDLRSLPMTQPEREQLLRALGEGEVRATIDAGGVSHIRETGVAGVWWVEHRDAHGELQAELLEVCRVPQLLARADDEIAAAARTLGRQPQPHADAGRHDGTDP